MWFKVDLDYLRTSKQLDLDYLESWLVSGLIVYECFCLSMQIMLLLALAIHCTFTSLCYNNRVKIDRSASNPLIQLILLAL